MANIFTVPTSGFISFDNNAFGGTSVQPLSTSPRLAYDGLAGLTVACTTSSSNLTRFSVEGSTGRLFTVTDILTGTLFTVSDSAGLPVLEVSDNDTVVMGEFDTNTLVVSGTRVGIGSVPFGTNKLSVSGNLTVVGNISANGVLHDTSGSSNNWNSVYSRVQSASASWDAAGASAGADYGVRALSANWQNTYTNFSTQSANNASVYSRVASASADWASNIDTGVRALSANWQNTYTNFSNQSANNASVYSSVSSVSSNWQNTYTNFSTNSASYATTSFANSKFLPLTGGTVTGNSVFQNNVTIYGNLSCSGTQTFANTIFSTTSALSVSHTGSGPAMWVGNNGTGDIASFYDTDQNVEVLHVGGNNGTFPNVGIKTSTPNKTFTVNGEISANNIIWDSTGNSNQWNSVYSNVQANSANYILHGGNSKGANLLVGTSDNFNLALETNNTPRITILNSGNVGIGTNSPSEKLTVSGNISASGSITTHLLELAQDRGSGDGPHIDFKTLPNEDFDCRIIQEENGLQVSTGGNGASFVRMTILSGGNVGINTGTPNERLTVAGNLSAKGLLYIGGSGGGRVYHNDEANTTRWESGILGFAGERNWSLYDPQAAQSRVTVLTSGNVGIGTRTPNENLTVVGNISASGIIYSQGEIAGASPTGSVMYYCLSSAPTGWIECNGAAITVAMGSAYTALRTLLINASNPFGVVGSDPKIPDLRGRFIRSFGTDSTVSPSVSSAAFGVKQADAFQGHTHAGVLFTGTLSYSIGCCGTGVPTYNPTTPGTPDEFNSLGTPRYGLETRPANIALLACIKL